MKKAAPAKSTGAKAAPKGGAKAPAAKKAPAKGAAAPAAKAAPQAPPKPKALPIEELGLKQLPEVLNDKHGLIKQSGRWPLLIDEQERVSVFLRHRDCNIVNVMDPQEMQPDRIRLALLGAIKFGKPLVFNLMEGDSLGTIESNTNQILPDLLPNLFDLMMTKKIVEEDRYFKLVVPTDEDVYTKDAIFGVGENFCVMFVTSCPAPSEDTMGKVIAFKFE